MKIIGKTLTADIKKCSNLKEYLSIEKLEKVMLLIAKKNNLKVVNKFFHHFDGGGEGITGALILAESHLIIHTYPEYNYIGLDMFICDLNVNLKKILYDFVNIFGSKDFTYSIKERIN